MTPSYLVKINQPRLNPASSTVLKRLHPVICRFVECPGPVHRLAPEIIINVRNKMSSVEMKAREEEEEEKSKFDHLSEETRPATDRPST